MASSKQKPLPGFEGHGEPSSAPTLKKGKFEAIGTFIDSGAMTSVSPKGISPNVKTGTASGMEY